MRGSTHLTLDDLCEEGTEVSGSAGLMLRLSRAELGVIAAALSLLQQLADDEIISLTLDEWGELDDTREPERREALSDLSEGLRAAYTAMLLGNPFQV